MSTLFAINQITQATSFQGRVPERDPARVALCSQAMSRVEGLIHRQRV